MSQSEIEYIDPPRRLSGKLRTAPARVALDHVPEDTGIQRNRVPIIEEGLAILDPKRESFEERQARLEMNRIPYAGMVAHQELAALILASGGTYKQAAVRAGVSVRQVKKYYSTADFRLRIDELRKVKFSKIAGRVLKELEKRTDPETIKNIELLDLLRVFDRVLGAPGGKGGVNIGEVNVQQNNYGALVEALLSQKRGGESSDFPGYGPEDLLLSGEGSPE